MTPDLVFDRFSYSYPGREPALRELSLSVEPGEFVLVAGRSGSGKSTLLRAAAGLVPHHYGGSARGEAAVCGLDLRTHRASELAAVCGSVMQDPEAQVVMGSVRHEIAFPLENLGWHQAAIDAAVAEIVDELDIEHLLERRTAELSGGELQRVVLAAALAPGPRVLSLDEPTAQLDPAAADEFFDTVDRLSADRGTTVLLAEHRLERSLARADRVVVVDGGELAYSGEPADFLDWAQSDPRGDRLLPAGARPYPRSPRRDADPAAAAVLALEGVEFTHPGAGSAALSHVSLNIKAGERVALMGPNGSGKSTLLRLARGLIRPAAGSVSVAGEAGLLLQNPNDYLIHERVGDEAPAAALERFGLAGDADRDPRDLSGGERQRLALAIVMQQRPAVLLLDEPTRGMDRERKLALVAELDAIAAAGTAVVLATHDAALATAFADRTLRLDEGRLVSVEPSPAEQSPTPDFAPPAPVVTA